MKLELKSKDSDSNSKQEAKARVTDKEKLQRVVDYDIVPELELYLHQLVKDVGDSLDNDPTDKSAGKEKSEEVKEENERCIVQRIREHVDKNKDCERKLDELTKTETKYSMAIEHYDDLIQEQIEKLGRSFVLNTVLPHAEETTQSAQV